MSIPVSFAMCIVLANLPTSNGTNVESERGRRLQQRFTEELFAKLEGIQPGVTECL